MEGDLRLKPSFWRDIFWTKGPLLKEAVGCIIHSGGKECQMEKEGINICVS